MPDFFLLEIQESFTILFKNTTIFVYVEKICSYNLYIVTIL